MANQAAHAGAFSLYTESSGAAIGNYAAGIAAEGADASIGWYNPAGLVLIHQQEVVLSGVGIFPSSKLSGTSTYSTTLPFIGPIPNYVQSFSDLQGAKDALVPAFHYAKPLGPNSTFGLSVVAPFGLSTDWGKQSPLRYQATLTDLKTINVSPEIGGKLTEHFSVGAGIDFQWAQVKFNQMLGAPAALQFLQSFGVPVVPTTLDSLSFNKGHSFGMGFHAGILGMFNDNHTRLGLNYQSRVKHQFHGYSTLTGRLADIPALTNPNATFRSDELFSNSVALPDVTTFSVYQDLNDRLALLGSIVYAGWSSFKVVQLNNVAAIGPEQDAHALVNSSTTEGYDNAFRVALGANYRFTDQWMLRVGGGYDETPTVDAHRDVRLPDANRWAASIGAHYQMRPNLGFDLGYTYIWADEDSKINNTTHIGETSTNNVTARGDNHVHLVGLQAVWMIDQPEVVAATK
jgi:long-chain fatty acid transport protein